MTTLSAESAIACYCVRDGYFGPPWVDVWEFRGRPLPHLFVHGGFRGTQTRFALYLPPANGWSGRVLTSIEGGPGGHESRAAALPDAALGSVRHAFSLGAALVESNGGHIEPPGLARSRGRVDGSITGYRATTEVTRLAQHVCRQVYGVAAAHSYVFGGSGGAWRTILALENAADVWDGGVAYISPAGHGVSFPAVVGNAVRVLGPAIERVIEAWEPGGSGDPFSGLSNRERTALAALYDAGLQPGAEAQLRHAGRELDVLLTTTGMLTEVDIDYLHDFWHTPGYPGADGVLAGELVATTGRITGLVTVADLGGMDPDDLADAVGPLEALGPGEPVGVRLDAVPPDARGADVLFGDTGRAVCVGVYRDVLLLDRLGREALRNVVVGDVVGLDNHRYLAACLSYLHQVDTGAAESASLLSLGMPVHPQRGLTVADVLAGVRTTGRPHGRLIYMTNLQDTLASPLGGLVNYVDEVRGHLGSQAAERLRVWVLENAGHLPASARIAGPVPVLSTRLLDWHGAVERALEHLVGWVERGSDPPADTSFTLEGTRVVLPLSAERRRGIQPIVQLAGGAAGADVAAGSSCELVARVEIPPGAGFVGAVEWDFDGTGTWPQRMVLPEGLHRVELTAQHVYEHPGTFYPSVRVTTPPEGGEGNRLAVVSNIARARVRVVGRSPAR